MNNRYLILVLLFCTLAFNSFSQEYIYNLDNLENSLPTKKTISFNYPLKQAKASLNSDSFNPEAGYCINLKNLSDKDFSSAFSGNIFIKRINFEVKQAKALNIYFDNLNLLEQDDKVYVRGDDEQQILLISGGSNLSNLGTSIFSGKNLEIIFTSTKDKNFANTLRQLGIIYSGNSRDFGDAAFCEVSVNCPEGDAVKKVNNAATRILVKQGSSLFWCTGSLVNNTAADRKPYVLTANHCGLSSSLSDYSDWVFDFNFESADCDRPMLEPEKQTIYGAQLIAHAPEGISNYSDFKLLLLEQEIPKSYNPYYMGWDRSGLAANNGHTIHHPQGDIKMVSTFTSPLTSTAYHDDFEDPQEMYWRVNWAETANGHGVTEGGSSGSPLLNENNLIIGTLTGGDAACNFVNDPDWYGKFSYHWDSDGTDSSRALKYWLDPIGSGVNILNGSSFDSSAITASFTSLENSIIIGGSVKFSNLSTGDINSYLWEFEGGEPASSDKREPGNIKYTKAGKFDVKLIVSNADDIDSLVFKDYINVGSYIFQGENYGEYVIKVGNTSPEEIQLQIYSSNGNLISDNQKVVLNSNGELFFNLSSYSSGVYLVKLNISGFIKTFKILMP